ncbi:hypothetical protein CONPUDRAFT_167660 [Coniophora puteana RWD-64-598 SS2]|uniref:Kinetochore protein Sos7 coiled-coil domain-containing protein n=1 Tax=Coniophora puteana (strain RWD-64-598) TaxID=741705 RepID=A0A5M3MHL5_CONPW|nr:uncharacterized protein CONPUDRAFT_167660 [Coniophora puteana RWD-64-598 SS2]EIW78719.1 hypothetical protein CONPUDRAFT_167660 [Coniophora puteana RWD-64-598 SS2]
MDTDVQMTSGQAASLSKSMSSQSLAESSIRSEAVKNLAERFQNTNLRIVKDKTALKERKFDGEDYDTSEGSSSGDLALKDPKVVASDVAAQLSFLRRLKFQYLEQNAKDKYIRTIVSDIDDAPLITAAGNLELQKSNENKKEVLRERKAALREREDDVRKLATFVEEDYRKAKSLIDEASFLEKQILDARLALTRLRQAHPPHNRLTIAAASRKLDAQVEEMQACDDELAETTQSIESVKGQIKRGVGEVEKLRSERGAIEKEVREGERAGGADGEENDSRIGGLYDWFSASLTLHRNLLSLVTAHCEAENELRLTYVVRPPDDGPEKEVQIRLLFVPNTRQLHSYEVTGVEVGDSIGAYVQSNDVAGLIWAVLAKARWAAKEGL